MRLFPLVICLLATFSTPHLHAKTRTYGDVSVTEVVSIYDGDTFTVNIKDWPSVAGERISVRIAGIDTPEMRGRCDYEKQRAREAKQFTVAALRNARQIRLQNLQRDKYFRLLSDVYVDGENLGVMLMQQGFAVPYAGKTKVDWCAR
ncbi:thermonuclease family protein [Simiduia agarivorans]|uniref:Micrococcal nuclease-like protein n=1 Tax=Simiduia agarivorans (strain DSM 21679 / JCM 13881 / BCRC 17597 / SA1) TaxID=1117647 RepID=R9S628_SIMAS|nr:thermonuclease family protein [Simiduia agarivorans]AGN11318.1 micrococcal nuclease-like protein [Simiduia agarivorans SA1 = DSM 21679]